MVFGGDAWAGRAAATLPDQRSAACGAWIHFRGGLVVDRRPLEYERRQPSPGSRTAKFSYPTELTDKSGETGTPVVDSKSFSPSSGTMKSPA